MYSIPVGLLGGHPEERPLALGEPQDARVPPRDDLAHPDREGESTIKWSSTTVHVALRRISLHK